MKGKPKDDEQKKEKKEGEKEEPKKDEKKRPEVRHIPRQIIRVAGTDLDGEMPVVRALRKIKGIGMATSSGICIAAKIDPMTKLGALGEAGIAELENVIKDPMKFNIPSFMLNRRRDLATGTDIHLTSSDLETSRRFDIQRYIDLHTYRGWRHMLGQPVRGQRTRSSFRVTGMAVGVMKKSVLAKPGAAPAAGTVPATAGKTEAAKPAASKSAESKPAKK